MIEKLTSVNGLTVFKCQGLLTASRFDPRGEAEAWCSKRSEFLDKVKTVFILGLGSAYHVEEVLRRSTAKVIVLETSHELIAAVEEDPDRAVVFKNERVKIVHVNGVRAVRTQENVRDAVTTSFVVLEHAASMHHASDSYRGIRELLLGRQWGALTWQWQLKGGQGLDENPKVSVEKKDLTIYDLESTELVQNSAQRERMLIKALRDLVK